MTCWLRGIAVAGLLGLGQTFLMDVGAHAEQGVFDDRILFGQSAAFDGPAAALGLGMREGILASFNEANAAGGVNGHRLELVSYDDGVRAGKSDCQHEAPDRRGGYAHFQRGAADRR
jgi:branched-chain amino acid transport system substrate-binding protein